MATAKKVARRAAPAPAKKVAKAPAKKAPVKVTDKLADYMPNRARDTAAAKALVKALKTDEEPTQGPRAGAFPTTKVVKKTAPAPVEPPAVPPSQRVVPPSMPGISIFDLKSKPLAPAAAKAAGYTHRTLAHQRALRGNKEGEVTIDTPREFSAIEIKALHDEGYEVTSFKQTRL